MTKFNKSDFIPAQVFLDELSRDERTLVEAGAAAILQEMHLAEIRKLLGKTQVAAGKSASMTQAEVSRLERSPETAQLRTLDRYVSGLGGKLQLVAVLPDGVQASIPLRHGKLVKSRLKVSKAGEPVLPDE